ncbi:MAG TPA: efflux transporter outer membrane subunit [Paraburkholderia sp.]|nr:efflux transporter outer membrane subunit [Paraburkholderia sp.]
MRRVALACALAATLSVGLGGCVPAGFGPKLTARAPDAGALAQLAPGTPQGAWPAPDWVASFADPQLDALVTDALHGNPDLQAARARIDIAQAELQQFASLTGLTATAGATVQKARLPQSDQLAEVSVGGRPVPVQLFAEPVVSPSALFVGLNYQLDLWGHNAALTRGLMSRRDAARVDAQQARLTLTVALVSLYCDLDQAYAARDLLNQKLAVNDEVDAVGRERAARGIDNGYDANDAALKRAQLREQIQLNDERLQLAQLQLGVLSGRGPQAGLALTRPHLAPLADAPLPQQLSLGLMGRRPDIVAARMRVEAADANLDAARAQFYPDVNLMALGGLAALTPAGLWSHDALTGSVGPAISLPIFDRKRLTAQLGENAGRADVAIALYNKTVDDALGQVAQQLTSLQSVDALIVSQTEAVDAQTAKNSIAAERQRRGLTTERDANRVRAALFDEQLRLADLRARRRTLRVGLIGALGGGFDAGADAQAGASAKARAALQAYAQAESHAGQPQAVRRAEPQAGWQAEPQDERQDKPQVERQDERQDKPQVEPQDERQDKPQVESQAESQVERRSERQAQSQAERQAVRQTASSLDPRTRPPAQALPAPSWSSRTAPADAPATSRTESMNPTRVD